MNTIDAGVIKNHAYLAAFDGTLLGPLADAPEIESDNEVSGSFIYENGGKEEVGQTLLRRTARITIRTKNINTALELQKQAVLGSDIAAAENRKPLKFTPITSNAAEKVLTFNAAVLLPDFSYDPGMGGDHIVTLTFTAYPDASGQLFTFE